MRRVLAGLGKWVNGTRSVDLEQRDDGWHARLVSRLDAQTEAFEAELLARERPSQVPGGPPTRVELPLFQRHSWIAGSKGEYRMFQLRDPDGKAAMQAAVLIDRPRRMPSFGRAYTPKLAPGISIEAEWFGVRALTALARQVGDLVSLRLQPYRRDAIELRDFEARARRLGFQLCNPVGVTRTLLVDLAPGPEQMLMDMSKKTRAKIKHKSRQDVIIRELDDPSCISACVAAVNASLARTKGGETQFDFEAAFALRARDPKRMRALGLFLSSQPDDLMAYAIAFQHGELAEYTSAGSLEHDQLRSMPFNYWLLWDLLCWGHATGARFMDLGGLTDGGPGDTRAGISAFKRHFTELDAEVGRELMIELQPARSLALTLWTEARARRQAKPD